MPRLLVNGLLLPAAVLSVFASGWYVITGETPVDLLDGMSNMAKIEAPMPPRLGAERASSSLIHPPAVANDPDVKMSMEPLAQPKPAAPAPAAPEAAAPPAPMEPAPPAPAPAEAAKPPVAAAAPAQPAGPTVAGAAPPPPMAEPAIPPGGEPLAAPSFAKLPSRADLKPLVVGPIPELLKSTAAGTLPITAGGREPRVAYARPFPADQTQPRVAVVVSMLGMSKDATDAAISKLPPEVSLSFSPYAGGLDALVRRARAAGHEVLLDLPLEPPNFPQNDGGTLSVLARNTPAEAMGRVEQVLGKTNSYVGLTGTLRSPVTASELWVPLLRSFKYRGLLFVGDGLVGVAEDDVPASATVTLVADELPFRDNIDARLAKCLAVAQRDGAAIVMVSPRPVSFERLLAWFDTFPQRGVVLAPVSAVTHPAAH